MSRQIFILFRTALVAFLFCASSRGALVSRAHGGFGADALTLDTQTGLSFLDLTFTRNRTYLEVAAQLAPGGLFDGFRYATLSEVHTLFLNAGITQFDVGTTGALVNYAAADALLDHLGVLSVLNSGGLTGRTTNGFVAPLLAGNTVKAIHLSARESGGVPAWGRADLNFFSPAATFRSNGYGSYLIATPEPSSFALVGCVMLAGLLRCKRQRTVTS